MFTEELETVTGNRCVYCSIIDRRFIDISGLFQNLLNKYSENHHKTVEDEPCVSQPPTRCYKWMLLLMKERIHLIVNASGNICKVWLFKTSAWNSTNTRCKRHNKPAQEGVGDYKDSKCQKDTTISTEHETKNLKQTLHFRKFDFKGILSCWENFSYV